MQLGRKTFLSIAVAMSLAAAANAQDGAVATEAERAAATLDAITVTAQRRVESLQQTPVAVSAINSEGLEDRGIASISDLSTNVPSFTVRTGTTDNMTSLISLRGQAQTRSDGGKQPSVGLYYDGVYAGALALSSPSSGMVDVEQVEVLRGPQGTLYGRNTPGGTVNITTKLPTDEVEGLAELSVGNNSRYGFAGVLNTPVGDRAAVRLVAQFQEDGGYAEDLNTGRELGDYDVQGLRGTLRVDLSDRLQVIGRAEVMEVQSGGVPYHAAYLARGGAAHIQARAAYGLPATQAGMDEAYERALGSVPDSIYKNRYSAYEQGSEANLGTGSLTVNYTFSDTLSLTSITAYRDFERIVSQDADGFDFDVLGCAPIRCAYYGAKQWTQDFQLNLDAADGRLRSVFGAFFYDLDAQDDFIFTAIPLINPAGTATNVDFFDTRSSAAYAHATFDLNDAWSIVGGIRYTTEESEMETWNHTATACAIPQMDLIDGECRAVYKTEADVWTWNIGANYQLNDDIFFYGKVGRGFKGGGLNPSGTATPGSYEPFAPEYVTEYEIGAKMDLLDRRLRTNIAAYFTDYTDIQRAVIVPSSGGGVASVTTNAAAAEVKGLELEVTALPTDRFELQGSYSYTDAKYTDYQGIFGDRSDLPFPGLAENQLGLVGIYRIPTSFGQVKLVGDVYYQSEVDYSPDDRDALVGGIGIQGGYTLFGAQLVLDLWESDSTVTFYAQNLGDKEFIVGSLYGGPSLGFASVIPGAPRTYGVRYTKRF